MKISIRSPLKYICEIDVEPTDLIGGIKSKIEESQGHAPSSQKIICSGRVLENDKTLESYGFREETDYLVLLVAKPKPTPTPRPSTATPAATDSSTPAIPSAPSLPSQTPVLPTEAGALSPDTASSSAANERSEKPKLSHATSLSGPSPSASASKIPPASAAPSTAISSMPTTKASLAVAAPASSDAFLAPATVSSAPGPSTRAFVDTSFFPTGEALQSTISNMVDMGFERDQVLRALRASYNDPNRAVEYLMTGIPTHLEAEAEATAALQVSSGPAPATDQPQNLFQRQLGAETGSSTRLAGLSRDPQFQQIRRNLMQNPEPLLQLMAVENPQLAQTLTANPGMLVQLLAAIGDSEDEGGSDAQVINQRQLGFDTSSSRDTRFQQFRQRLRQNPEPFLQFLAVQNPRMAQALAANPELFAQLLAAAGDSEGEGSSLTGAQAINVTGEDAAAVERLEAFGFARPAVIEAYLACDKNEELAVNYLLENTVES